VAPSIFLNLTKPIKFGWHHVEADPKFVFVQVLVLLVAQKVHGDVIIEVTVYDGTNTIHVTIFGAEDVTGELEAIRDSLSNIGRDFWLVTSYQLATFIDKVFVNGAR